jgi:hypothetical protein
MRRLLLSLLAALVAMVMVASPAGAITYGEPDAGEHPYVGFMIFFDPNEPGWFSCSGTLLDANTFLTAGHCTYGIGPEGEVVLGPDGEPLTSGGTDVWVTFNETEVLAGWPPVPTTPRRKRSTTPEALGWTRTPTTSRERPIPILTTTTSPDSRSTTTWASSSWTRPLPSRPSVSSRPWAPPKSWPATPARAATMPLSRTWGTASSPYSQSPWRWRRGTSRPRASSRSTATSPRAATCIP